MQEHLNGAFIEAGTTIDWSFSGQTILVKKIVIHPLYNNKIGAPYDNDIAILKLDSTLIFNEGIHNKLTLLM